MAASRTQPLASTLAAIASLSACGPMSMAAAAQAAIASQATAAAAIRASLPCTSCRVPIGRPQVVRRAA
jgi:hypothetical protein